GKKFKKCCYSPDDDGEADEAAPASPEQAAAEPVESAEQAAVDAPTAPPEAEGQAVADAEQTPTDESPVTA
ncbi:MAG: hypothetical protein RIT28_2170, partial [Pseudomonadota bacterium]